MKIQGRVWRFGDDIDTDKIIPARYLTTSDPAELARHCMEDEDPAFAGRVRPGEIIVAGKNFGCGSSREHAPISIKAAGVACVIAPSFARIFYRNAINIGLPILESAEIQGIESGHELAIDLDKGLIRDLTTGREFAAKPFPPFMQELISLGGLVNYVRKKVGAGPG